MRDQSSIGQAGESVVVFSKPASQTRKILKVKADFPGQRSRSDIVSSAKGREKIVKCGFVGHVYDRKARTPTVAVAMEEIVIAERNVKQTAWGDAWRIVVVVFSARFWNRNVF